MHIVQPYMDAQMQNVWQDEKDNISAPPAKECV